MDPIPAADHWPIMSNYLYLYTGEIKGMMVDTHVHGHTHDAHTHTFIIMLNHYENRPVTIQYKQFSSGFGINMSYCVTLMRSWFKLLLFD